MRALCLSLVATVVIILAGAAVVVGQSSDPTGPAKVSIQVVDTKLVTPGVMRPDATRAVYHEDGRKIAMTWQSSDGRLSGAVTAAGSRHINRDGSSIETEAYLVTNSDGRWVGQSTGLAVTQPKPDFVIGNGLLPVTTGHVDRVLLKGEGSYEGLSALVDIDWYEAAPAAAGLVFRGDMPMALTSGTAG
jgi:hypothetical protein